MAHRHYRIFERELPQPSAEFIGHRITSNGRDVLFQEQRKRLHYVNEATVREGEFTTVIRCESWHCGLDYDDLITGAQDWIDQVREGKLPSILVRRPAPESEELEESFGNTPFGSGTVKAQLYIAPGERIVDLVLRWEPDETFNQPDFWEITWCHGHPLIWDNLEGYLRKYCPVPDQVYKTAHRLYKLSLDHHLSFNIEDQ